MTNLIPQKARKAVLKEYWIRTLSVWAFLIGFGFLFLSLLSFPSYLLLHSQLRALALETSSTDTRSAEVYQEAVTKIKEANKNALKLSESASSEVLATAILDEIQNIAKGEITVEAFILKNDGKNARLDVRGHAPTRHALVSFGAELEKSPLFLEADIPVENLAKDTDIPFSITIVMNK